MYIDISSRLLNGVDYDETGEVTFYFNKYYVNKLTYVGIPWRVFSEFILSESKGKYYLTHIKNNYKLKTEKMADKIIRGSIDVTKIDKKWLFSGDKGVYLNFTILFNEKEDQHGQNGMVTQNVPKEVYDQEVKNKVPKDQRTKGAILGNVKDFTQKSTPTAFVPGEATGVALGAGNFNDDDLPF